jgi:lipid II:glycine glycyltransferase (peptidoglycan interpeptide bridge formation enzyme)
MELIPLSEQNDIGKFNRFVAEHPSGDFLQSWDWGGWQEKLGKKVFRFAVYEQSATLLAAQAIQVQIPNMRRYYLYIPHGPLLNNSLTGKDGAKVVDFFINGLVEQFPQTLFVRIEPTQDYIPRLHQKKIKKTVNIQAGKTLVLGLAETELAELLAAMHPKTRYNIKIAQKHGITVRSDLAITPQDGLHLPEAVRLITDTAKRQKYRGYPAGYYKSLIDYFGTRSGELTLTIYKAFYEKTLLASAIMVDFGAARTYLFGGSSQLHRNTMAPYLLHWQAITDAKEKGLTSYDFGGSETAGGKTDLGFNRFKLGFGTTQRNFPGTYDIIQRPAWYTIYTALRSINRKF